MRQTRDTDIYESDNILVDSVVPYLEFSQDGVLTNPLPFNFKLLGLNPIPISFVPPKSSMEKMYQLKFRSKEQLSSDMLEFYIYEPEDSVDKGVCDIMIGIDAAALNSASAGWPVHDWDSFGSPTYIGNYFTVVPGAVVKAITITEPVTGGVVVNDLEIDGVLYFKGQAFNPSTGTVGTVSETLSSLTVQDKAVFLGQSEFDGKVSFAASSVVSVSKELNINPSAFCSCDGASGFSGSVVMTNKLDVGGILTCSGQVNFNRHGYTKALTVDGTLDCSGAILARSSDAYVGSVTATTPSFFSELTASSMFHGQGGVTTPKLTLGNNLFTYVPWTDYPKQGGQYYNIIEGYNVAPNGNITLASPLLWNWKYCILGDTMKIRGSVFHRTSTPLKY